MYCDQPSLMARDPSGGVNKEIPHRWGKQPHRKQKHCSTSSNMVVIIYYYIGGEDKSTTMLVEVVNNTYDLG